jgi:hypothetical protein
LVHVNALPLLLNMPSSRELLLYSAQHDRITAENPSEVIHFYFLASGVTGA